MYVLCLYCDLDQENGYTGSLKPVVIWFILPLDAVFMNETGVVDILIPHSWFVYIMHFLSQNQMLHVNCIWQICCVTMANSQARGNIV